MTKAVAKRFEIVKKSKDAWAFRWRYTDTAASPVFTLTVGAGAELDRAVTKPAKAYAVLSIDDLDAALDDANGLIEAQAVIQGVTKQAFFLSWNGERVAP